VIKRHIKLVRRQNRSKKNYAEETGKKKGEHLKLNATDEEGRIRREIQI